MYRILKHKKPNQSAHDLTRNAPAGREPLQNFEALESRVLLSADVSLFAAGGIVDIQGDDQRSAIEVSVQQETFSGAKVVNSGTTSVFLDTATLEAAASLIVSSINSTGTPAAGAFQAGFNILGTSDFTFNQDGGITPIAGTIQHEGTVGFNGDSIIVGDFDINFDADRVSATTSGFYVTNTVDGVLKDLVLFDVGNPGGLNIGGGDLDILGADLLVSAEFAQVLIDVNLATANLTGADVGDAQINAETAHFISGGTTSVFLDLATLSAAANLNATDISSDGTPFSGDFQVGFPITESTDFRYSTEGGLALLGGTIKHEGTVTFNDALTVGDFDITAAEARGTGNSGLVVISTAEGPLNGLILFDIADPGGLTADADGLTVTGADLRVSPEFAAVLADPAFAGADLTGAVVGNARVDATAGDVVRSTVTVEGDGYGTTVNGEHADSVTVTGLEAINIALEGGRDRVKVDHSTIDGDLNIDLGNGRDSAWVYGVDILGELAVTGGHGSDKVSVTRSSAEGLSIDTGAGSDQIRLTHADIRGDADVDTGANRDLLRVLSSHFAGDSSFDLGSGRDAFRSLFSDYNGQADIDGGSNRDSFVSIFDSFDDLDRSGFERNFKI